MPALRFGAKHTFVLFCFFLVVPIAAVITACSSSSDKKLGRDLKAGDIDGKPTDITVGLLLQDDKLTVLGTAAPRLADNIDDPPRLFTATDPVIFWELTNDKGAITANGALIDPRRSQSELDENGEASPFDVVGNAAMFDITVPNIGGTIHLYERPKQAGGSTAGGGVRVQSLHGGSEIAPAASIPVAVDGEPTSELVPADPEAAPAASGPTDLGQGLKRIVDNSRCGDDFRVLIVPEGYTNMATFARDAAALASSFQSIRGFAEHSAQMSIYTQDFVSTDEGISDPDNSIALNTAFNASFGRGALRRCVFPHAGIPRETAAKLFLAKERSGADVVALLTNTTEHGGCAQPTNRLIALTRSATSSATLAHEMGHALFDLSDEYVGGGSTCNARGADTPNTGNNVRALPWAAMLTTDVLPSTGTDNATVGAFEGARYCARGVYRPSPNCKMKSSTVDFCPVCKRRVDTTFAARRTARRKPNCDADAGPDASRPDAGGDAGPRVRPDASTGGGPPPDAGRPQQPRLYDSCEGRRDGVYCSELVDFSAIVCEGNTIKEGQQCGGGKCTGPNGPGKTIQCSGTGSDAPNVDSCAGRADGVYCSQLATDFAYVCAGGTIAGGLNCPNEGQRCAGPNGAGTEITCR